MRCVVGFAALLLAVGCIEVAGPSSAVLRYQITALGCDTPCIRPNRTPIDSAFRGDTVWIEHVIELFSTADTTFVATIRPDCRENVAIEVGTSGDSIVASMPAPETCPDSTVPQSFVNNTPLTRLTRWPVDTGLTPGLHLIVGRILELPRVEPKLGFTVR